MTAERLNPDAASRSELEQLSCFVDGGIMPAPDTSRWAARYASMCGERSTTWPLAVVATAAARTGAGAAACTGPLVPCSRSIGTTITARTAVAAATAALGRITRCNNRRRRAASAGATIAGSAAIAEATLAEKSRECQQATSLERSASPARCSRVHS